MGFRAEIQQIKSFLKNWLIYISKQIQKNVLDQALLFLRCNSVKKMFEFGIVYFFHFFIFYFESNLLLKLYFVVFYYHVLNINLMVYIQQVKLQIVHV